MSDVYRIDKERLDLMSDYQKHRVETALGTALHDEVLVPVEPCEHGKIDRHIITDYDGQGVHRDDMKWCPDAAVKGDNDE